MTEKKKPRKIPGSDGFISVPIKLPVDLHAKLKAIADEEERVVSKQARLLLKEAIEAFDKPVRQPVSSGVSISAQRPSVQQAQPPLRRI